MTERTVDAGTEELPQIPPVAYPLPPQVTEHPNSEHCPNCSGPLTAVDYGADSPPWACYGCYRGWWQSEIDSARHWDAETQSWPPQVAAGVLDACEQEAAQDVDVELQA